MDALTLTRSPEDRRRYDLVGIGSIRRPGWFSRGAEIRTALGVLGTTAQSLTGKTASLTDRAGGIVAEYARTRWVDHGGTVTWRGLPYDLVVESHWRNRYLLSRHGVEAVRVTCRGWGKEPATVEVLEATTDPGLVLFTTWLAQTFVEMNASAGA